MADTEREDRERRRAAVEREMTRLRTTDDPDETEETGERDRADLIDAVDDALRRKRDVAEENGDQPA
jgi:hypothetical protein